MSGRWMDGSEYRWSESVTKNEVGVVGVGSESESESVGRSVWRRSVKSVGGRSESEVGRCGRWRADRE